MIDIIIFIDGMPTENLFNYEILLHKTTSKLNFKSRLRMRGKLLSSRVPSACTIRKLKRAVPPEMIDT